jgi:hypothetical protein
MGQSLYNTGKAKLMDDKEDKFDLKVMRFHEMLQARSEIMDWANPMQGIITYQIARRDMNLILEYGQMPYNEKRPSLGPIGSMMEQRSIRELCKTTT